MNGTSLEEIEAYFKEKFYRNARSLRKPKPDVSPEDLRIWAKAAQVHLPTDPRHLAYYLIFYCVASKIIAAKEDGNWPPQPVYRRY
ncbi:MAG: hypothetical protein NT086_13635 [Proteobacteria bacterium]|nr:hypothetical protein [Pseudomonadota bacterium]